MTRLPVSPETCTVNGYRVKPTDTSWTGLDLANAEPRTQSTMMLAVVGSDDAPPDIHLNVPWCHPEDRANGAPADDCIYRVRPRMKVGRRWKGDVVRSLSFERWSGSWFLALEFAPKGRKRRAA